MCVTFIVIKESQTTENRGWCRGDGKERNRMTREGKVKATEGIHNRSDSLHPFPFADNQPPFKVTGQHSGLKTVEGVKCLTDYNSNFCQKHSCWICCFLLKPYRTQLIFGGNLLTDHILLATLTTP